MYLEMKLKRLATILFTLLNINNCHFIFLSQCAEIQTKVTSMDIICNEISVWVDNSQTGTLPFNKLLY
jgi:hypothetical protein